jgi:nucleotidyltransferase substrate binding protein (TIGR01987 family)
MDHDVRWKQRLEHLESAFLLLDSAVSQPTPTALERAGLIHFFEMAFELAWKVLKDYMEFQGYVVIGPRDVLKQAFKAGIIDDGHCWIAALEDRNLIGHTYREATSKRVEALIRESYHPIIASLRHRLRDLP